MTATGSIPVLRPTLALSVGWNLIGLPTAGASQTASTLLNSLTAAGLNLAEVARWTGGEWPTLLRRQGGDMGADFAISPEEGYFVFVQHSGDR